MSLSNETETLCFKKTEKYRNIFVADLIFNTNKRSVLYVSELVYFDPVESSLKFPIIRRAPRILDEVQRVDGASNQFITRI